MESWWASDSRRGPPGSGWYYLRITFCVCLLLMFIIIISRSHIEGSVYLCVGVLYYGVNLKKNSIIFLLPRLNNIFVHKQQTLSFPFSFPLPTQVCT